MASRNHSIRALTFLFRGVGKSEQKAAKEVGEEARVTEHRIVRLPDLRERAHIRGVDFGGMPGTYVPMRNAMFYSWAAGYAEEVRAAAIYGGHNRDDLRVFPDVGEGFFEALQGLMSEGSPILRKSGTKIVRPLSSRSKTEVVRMASRLGVPLHLTWSCHRGGREHCWRCAGCRGRMTAFEGAGVADPIARASAGKIS